MEVFPKATVLMPVYNGEQHLAEAIDSVLAQSFKNFEFLIINDGSTDNSEKIIRSYTDERIRLVNNESNLKLIATLNKGLALAKGEYVFRMDCDDICLPQRLAVQVEFMDQHPQIGICGTFFQEFGSGKVDTKRGCNMPLTDAEIRTYLFFKTVFAHPTVCLRRSVLEQHQLSYRHEYIHAEDYKLWVDASQVLGMANIPQVLLRYRVHGSSITQKHRAAQKATTQRILLENIQGLGVSAPEGAQDWLAGRIKDTSQLKQFKKMLGDLMAANQTVGKYAEPLFTLLLNNLWYKTLVKSGIKGILYGLLLAPSAADIKIGNLLRYLKVRQSNRRPKVSP